MRPNSLALCELSMTTMGHGEEKGGQRALFLVLLKFLLPGCIYQLPELQSMIVFLWDQQCLKR